jgi:hypothetical protein
MEPSKEPQLMTLVVVRPLDEARLNSFLLGLEVLWPFQVAAFVGDATIIDCGQRLIHEPRKPDDGQCV